jgi:hypothetical protein
VSESLLGYEFLAAMFLKNATRGITDAGCSVCESIVSCLSLDNSIPSLTKAVS